MYEVYIWIIYLGSRGKCKRAIHVNKNKIKIVVLVSEPVAGYLGETELPCYVDTIYVVSDRIF